MKDASSSLLEEEQSRTMSHSPSHAPIPITPKDDKAHEEESGDLADATEFATNTPASVFSSSSYYASCYSAPSPSSSTQQQRRLSASSHWEMSSSPMVSSPHFIFEAMSALKERAAAAEKQKQQLKEEQGLVGDIEKECPNYHSYYHRRAQDEDHDNHNNNNRRIIIPSSLSSQVQNYRQQQTQKEPLPTIPSLLSCELSFAAVSGEQDKEIISDDNTNNNIQNRNDEELLITTLSSCPSELADPEQLHSQDNSQVQQHLIVNEPKQIDKENNIADDISPTITSESSTSTYSLLYTGDIKQQQQEEQHFNGSNPDETVATGMEKKQKEEEGTSILICFIYGMINATIVLPVIISFGSIIYCDDAFQPYMPVLIKLTLASGFVHQLSFSSISSLPFAIGQVQDAGLIFLSKMATDIVSHCRNNYDNFIQIEGNTTKELDEIILATTTIGLAIATCILGCSLVMVGKCKLAQYVQMLPTCVIGGYLAYIGWFCGISGVGIMANASGDQLTIITFWDKIIFIIPGILGGIMIYTSVRILRHMIVLPLCIILLFILFYIILYISETSISDATNNGWILQTETPPVWYHSWDYLKFNNVMWSALPQLIITEIGMVFVVALSSALDIAAIELELTQQVQQQEKQQQLLQQEFQAKKDLSDTPKQKQPQQQQQPQQSSLLDYNHELITVGLSNIISGCTGGYTGSYIFSQSIFSLRAGIKSRYNGYFLALVEIIVFVLPFNVLAYVPNFFFGSLLIMICLDLLYEWLYHVKNKISTSEYIICWLTFLSIHILSVEYGILFGVIIHMLWNKIKDKFDGDNNDNTNKRNNEDSVVAEEKLLLLHDEKQQRNSDSYPYEDATQNGYYGSNDDKN